MLTRTGFDLSLKEWHVRVHLCILSSNVEGGVCSILLKLHLNLLFQPTDYMYISPSCTRYNIEDFHLILKGGKVIADVTVFLKNEKQLGEDQKYRCFLVYAHLLCICSCACFLFMNMCLSHCSK